MNELDIREIILKVISEHTGTFQTSSVLRHIEQQLPHQKPLELQQAVLTQFYDLFRTGYLSPGYDLTNPDFPHVHTTERGKKLLANLSRDPGNPSGYLHNIEIACALNDIAQSYLEEAVSCYVAGQYKASAVMIGGAAEAVVLELKDLVISKVTSYPKALDDWRIKKIIDALNKFFEQEKSKLDSTVKESFEAYWTPFTSQIRTVRNEAGHPSSIAPITEDSVHASLLIFPEMGKLAKELKIYLNSLNTSP